MDSGSTADSGASDSGATSDSGTSDSGATSDSGTTSDSGATDAATPAGPCPATRPDASDACTEEGRVCEYGVRTCLSVAECVSGAWQVAIPRCPPPPTGGCPATREAASGTACAGDEGASCVYDDGLLCTCTSCPVPYPICMVVDPPVWACEAPNPDMDCPVAQPLLGTECSMEAQTCDYGCEEGERRVCSGGGWIAGSAPGGCPRSTRRAKRDIEYLDADDVDALAGEVARTRLATYEYTDPALAGRRHLGFILEDQPGSYSVDPERSQVDLYGYTSMLVAAVQAQQRQIDALEREVRELRATRPAR
ncbi:MAG: hypothetical protein H6719_20645 [Sandaracinaceae bacterium]|nr:hypothetical protein [Sandaracinaceae bacterium]